MAHWVNCPKVDVVARVEFYRLFLQQVVRTYTCLELILCDFLDVIQFRLFSLVIPFGFSSFEEYKGNGYLSVSLFSDGPRGIEFTISEPKPHVRVN